VALCGDGFSQVKVGPLASTARLARRQD